MSTLWIIRHGQASFGDVNYDKLSDLGQTQSRILGRFFRQTGVSFHSAFTGDMLRQTETADLVLGEMAGDGAPLSTVSDPAFNEYDHHGIITALLPGLLDDEPEMSEVLPHILTDNRKFQKMFVKIVDRWISGNYPTPGAESFRSYVDRVERGLVRVAESAEERSVVGIFTSGGVVSVAMKAALNLTDQEAIRLSWWVKNTAVTVLDWRKGRFNLTGFNSLSHLDMERCPDLLTYR